MLQIFILINPVNTIMDGNSTCPAACAMKKYLTTVGVKPYHVNTDCAAHLHGAHMQI